MIIKSTVVTMTLFLLLIFILNASADNALCEGFPGFNMTCGSGQLRDLKGVMVTLNGTLVQGDAEIYGKLVLNDGAVLEKNLKIGGVLVANDSFVSGVITLGSNSVVLSHCVVHAINVMHSLGTSTIRLKNKTRVIGDIRFLSNNGIIYLQGGSQIVGQVYGARIIVQEPAS